MAYGLRPVGMGGTKITAYSTGGFSEYPIVDGSTVDWLTGDFVELGTDGYVLRPNGATGETPTSGAGLRVIGVVVGFRYDDANSTPVWGQKYTGHASNTNAFAMVVDDPNQVFMIRSNGNTTFADVGANAPVTTFNNTTDANLTAGLSGIQLLHGSIASTASLALRIVGVANADTSTATTRDVLVKINTGVHATTNATGDNA